MAATPCGERRLRPVFLRDGLLFQAKRGVSAGPMRALMLRMQAVIAGILVLTSGGALAWPAGPTLNERMELPSTGLVQLTRSRHRTHQVPVGIATIPGSRA